MRMPKVIGKNNREYIFVKQINENMFLYQEMLYGYKECFSKHDLGLIKKQKELKHINPEKVIF